jgi:hypothetical protein
MKRFMVLVMLAAFILGSVGTAQAVELKAKGVWRVHFNYLKDRDFNNKSEIDDFLAMQRARVMFDFIASENLKGVLELEIGNLTWGAEPGGQLNADGVNVKTRNAYLQFLVPGTQANVKAGIQYVALPSTFGSHILAADQAGLLASLPLNDMLGLTLGWTRPYDVTQGTFETSIDDEVDVFFAVLPITLDGMKLNPFGVFARWGKDILKDKYNFDKDGKNANEWFGGLNFSVDIWNPIVIRGDINYGTVKFADDFTAAGYIADLSVQYKMDMVIPELFFLYESGEDSSYARGGDSDRMPTIGTDANSWEPTTFGLAGSAFGSSDAILRSFIAKLPGATALDSYWAREGSIGMWVLAAKLGKISFIDKLTHDLVLSYATGTNETENVQLFTSDDKYYEITFDHDYMIYENLAARLELGWGKLDLNDTYKGRSDLANSDAWKAAFGFLFRF